MSDAAVARPVAPPPRVVAGPRDRGEWLAAWREVRSASVAFWDAMPDPVFWRPLGEAWSPAENVVHLIRSNAPVAQALALPRPLLALLFGVARRGSRSYDALVADYHAALAGGLEAGRFGPSRRRGSSSGDRRRLMGRHAALGDLLERRAAAWSDRSLDRFRLPHPGLGKLTVREMLNFTLYHNVHHPQIVARRLAAS